MASASYSYIDISSLDAVRERFAAGDALVILSADLEEVIWANGPGAELFGGTDIASVVGVSPRLSFPARRQIMSTSGYPAIGRDRAIHVRIASGMSSRAVQFLASSVDLPDGETAILLAVPASAAADRSPEETAARAISGLAGQGEFTAMVDGDGNVLAASSGYDQLRVPTDVLAGLIADSQGDRLVKRMIPVFSRTLPAGFVRLTDTPPTHLMVVVEDGIQPAEGAVEGSQAEASSVLAVAAEPAPEPVGEVAAPSGNDDRWYFHGDSEAGAAALTDGPARDETPAAEQIDIAPAEAASYPDETSIPQPEPAAPAAEDSPSATPDMTPPEAPAPTAIEPASPIPVDRASGPVRFVWRTDAAGRFSSISPEFATAVGPQAAAIIGMAFRDVAAAFAIDPDGEIAGLLERRDTWSGRSVLWPVAGTDLRIPVDLAALPAYARDRSFEGFRGFGVARGGDAVVDPDATGMRLVSAPRQAEPVEESLPEDPFKGEVRALVIEDGPERRYTDKVIRLAERREPANDRGLTIGERSAFREIGDRLRTDAAAPETAEEGQPDPEAAAIDEPANEAEAATAPSPAEPSSTATAPYARTAATPQDVAAEVLARIAQADMSEAESYTSLADEPVEADLTPVAIDAPSEEAAPSEPEIPADLPSIPEPVAETTVEETIPADTPEPAVVPNLETSSHASPVGLVASEPAPTEPIADQSDAVPDLAASADTDQPAAVDTHAAAAADAPPVTLKALASGIIPSAFATGMTGAPRLAVDTGILEQLPVPVLIHHGDRLHYANREFLDLTGYETVEMLEEAGGLGELFGEPYHDGVDETGDRKLRLRTSEGLEFPVEAFLQSVPWNDGKALLLSLRRVGRAAVPAKPARAPAEAAQIVHNAELAARVAEMRAIIDTATDGVVLIGPDGTIRSFSRAAEALFGLESAQVAGKHFASLFAIESQRAARDYLSGLAENGVASVLNDGREVIGREAQGRFIPLFMTIGRLPNDTGYCAVMRDITQWKRAEEDLTQARAQAERASSQKTDFLARVSHEIRTPLNAIIGFSELMLDEKFGPVGNDRYRDYLRDINRSGNHVLDLVNDLLDISKIEAGQQEMDYEAVSLNDTLGETVAMMQPQANRERVIIRSSFASRLPEVVADLRSVRQIALNLLSNAIRYTQAGGQVIVSTAYEQSGDVIMRVRDTGIGMSAPEIEQALKPFKQVSALRRGRGEGTGLGLPLTKAMVEANRARFTITSSPGEGTLVEVIFPSTRVLAD